MEPEGSLPHSQLPATLPILSQLDPVNTLSLDYGSDEKTTFALVRYIEGTGRTNRPSHNTQSERL